MVNSRFVIAIVGPSASGKTTFSKSVCQQLAAEFQEEVVTLISEDSYYKDQSHLLMEERTKTNYDHPNAYEHELLKQHIEDAQQNKNIDIPIYSHAVHNRSQDSLHVEPNKVIIVEGIMLLSNPVLRDQFHLRVFIDTPLDLCLARRLERDIIERQRSVESVLSQYKKDVRPAYINFISPSKQNADIIVTGGGFNQSAIDVVKARIKTELRQQ